MITNYLLHHVVCDYKVDGTPLETPFMYSTVMKAASCSIYRAIAELVGIQVIPGKVPSVYQGWDKYGIELQESAKYVKNRFHFTFVRNTYSRLVSAYQMLSDIDYPSPQEFRSWLKKVVEKGTAADLHTDTQLRTLDPMPSLVGRVETIEEDWRLVQEITGLPDLKHENKSSVNVDYREYYDRETKTLVEETYSREIEVFGFKFL